MMHYFGNKRQGGFHVHSSQIIEGTFYELFDCWVIWSRNNFLPPGKTQYLKWYVNNTQYILSFCWNISLKTIPSCNTTSILSINSCKADGWWQYLKSIYSIFFLHVFKTFIHDIVGYVLSCIVTHQFYIV